MKVFYTLFILSLLTVAIHASASASAKIITHNIKKGETLYIIAHKNHTTIAEVRKINGIKKGDLLKIGRDIKVPQNTYFPNKTKIVKNNNQKKVLKIAKYTIKKGDTLFIIARKHHTSIADILKINDIQYKQLLKLGQVLKVPKNTYFSNKKQKLVIPIKNKKSFKPKKIYISTLVKKTTNIIRLAKGKLGRRYVWGASGTKNTFDCSSFTKYIYNKNGINIPRTSIKQSKHGKYVTRSNLKKGDLIFFDTSKRRKGYVNHVGIYLGNNKFIHASSAKKKVVITSLKKKFYSQRYKGARRPS